MFKGLNGNGYQPIPDTDEFSGWVSSVRGESGTLESEQ